jgi:hypothetical protein
VLVGVAVLGVVGVVGGALSRERPPALKPKRVAVPSFANHTGRPDLDDLGVMAADWIVRGLMETPVVDVTDVEALYADGQYRSERPIDPMTFARRNGAGMAIRGSYYRSGDSVLFQAGIIDVASGRVLRSLEPVGTSLETPTAALEALREGIAVGLSPLVNADYRGWAVDPDLVVPPNFAAYREFVAALRETNGHLGSQAEHLRRAARLDSTFVAPLVQLAFVATWSDDCASTDSIGGVLEARMDELTAWDRLTIETLRACCRGELATAVQLLEQRYRAYPSSIAAQVQYAWSLQRSNQARAAGAMLEGMDPEDDRGGENPHRQRQYWWHLAGSRHILGEYDAELDITDRWRDSTSEDWQVVRGRALAGLGREREAMELLGSMPGAPVDSVAKRQLTIAIELSVHGYPGAAMVVAESVLSRAEPRPDIGPEEAGNIAWANRLLGRKEAERGALESIVQADVDTLTKLQAAARIAVLLADTAAAERIDGILAEESTVPLRDPWVRGAQILARAHIAAGLGRREGAVDLLQEAKARGMIDLGSSHAFHIDLLLAPLRGYPPFEALLQPD